MKKFEKITYASLFYNSSVGYTILIQGKVNSFDKSVRVVFCDSEDAKEYLEAKTGKVFPRIFQQGFCEIYSLIVSAPDIQRELRSAIYNWDNGNYIVQPSLWNSAK